MSASCSLMRSWSGISKSSKATMRFVDAIDRLEVSDS